MVLIPLQHRTQNTQAASETSICALGARASNRHCVLKKKKLLSCQKVRSLSRSRVILMHVGALDASGDATPEVSVWAAFAVLDVLFVCFFVFQALVLQETKTKPQL